MKVKIAQSCPTLCNPMDYIVHGILQTRILEWVAFPSPGGFPNPGLPHCRRILYQLSHKGGPRILEWLAYQFSRGFSRPRNWTGVYCIAGRFFTNWAIREALIKLPLPYMKMMHILYFKHIPNFSLESLYYEETRVIILFIKKNLTVKSGETVVFTSLCTVNSDSCFGRLLQSSLSINPASNVLYNSLW